MLFRFRISITTSTFINTRSACPSPYPSLPGFSEEKRKLTLRFLTRGGSCAPIDQLVEAGADPRGEQVYDDAFRYFEETAGSV